ncbi:hypothetical protein FQZ97_863030 [compost metagenome]
MARHHLGQRVVGRRAGGPGGAARAQVHEVAPGHQQPLGRGCAGGVERGQRDARAQRAGQAFPHFEVLPVDAGLVHAVGCLEHHVAGVGCAARGLQVDLALPGADLGLAGIGVGDQRGATEALLFGAAGGGGAVGLGRHTQVPVPQAGLQPAHPGGGVVCGGGLQQGALPHAVVAVGDEIVSVHGCG